MNPKVCTICEYYAVRYQGGAEVELSLVFADIRGSTHLAETMTPTEFSKLINRFYTAASDVLVKNDGMIDKLAGDQVAGIFVPGLAGQEHPCKAIRAAQMILRATGHGEPGGPWAPVGAGVHTGTAFVGAVGSTDGTTDITVLGDAANIAARLSSNAGQGEILISEQTCAAAGPGHPALRDLDVRHLQLKGKSGTVAVQVLTNYEVS
jgi:adenylate cyclase